MNWASNSAKQRKTGVFSESTRCVGTCGLAPVVVIGDKVYGNMTPDQVPGLIEKYAYGAAPGQEARIQCLNRRLFRI